MVATCFMIFLTCNTTLRPRDLKTVTLKPSNIGKTPLSFEHLPVGENPSANYLDSLEFETKDTITL